MSLWRKGVTYQMKAIEQHFPVLLLITGAPNCSIRKIYVRKALNRLRYSDLIVVKARDLFGETSPRTFVTRGLISSYCFPRDKYVI